MSDNLLSLNLVTWTVLEKSCNRNVIMLMNLSSLAATTSCTARDKIFFKMTRAVSRFAPSQWETSLQSNAISHWLGAKQESALNDISISVYRHIDTKIYLSIACFQSFSYNICQGLALFPTQSHFQYLTYYNSTPGHRNATWVSRPPKIIQTYSFWIQIGCGSKSQFSMRFIIHSTQGIPWQFSKGRRSTIEMETKIDSHVNILAQQPPNCRWHFQQNFLEWKHSYLDWNFTAVCC